MSTETANAEATQIIIPSQEHGSYKPLQTAIPKEQSEKLSGLSLVHLEQNQEKEKEEVVPEKKEEVEVEKEEPVKEEPKVEPETKKENVKIESSLGDLDIPTEVKVEVEDDDDKAKKDFAEIAGSQKKQEQAFINLRRELKAQKVAAQEAEVLRNQVEELKNKPAEVKADPELQARYEAVDTELKSAKEQLENFRKDAAVYRVEKTDDYINKVDRPFREEILPAITVLSKATGGILSKQLLDNLALMEPTQAREELRKLRDDSGIERDDYNEFSALVPKHREVIKVNAELKKNADKMIALRAKEEEDKFSEWRKGYQQKLGSELKARDEAVAKKLFSGIEDQELSGMIAEARKGMDKKLEAFDWDQAPVEARAQVLAEIKNTSIALYIKDVQIKTLTEKLSEFEKENVQLKKEQDKLTKASPAAGVTSAGEKKVEIADEEFKGKLDASALFKMAPAE